MNLEKLTESIDLAQFAHKIADKPKTYEMDFQGVVHNTRYFYWLESARVEYFRLIGAKFDKDVFVKHDKFMVARQEINYRNPVFFENEYEVLTRISLVKNTSFVFEHVILSNGKMIADSKAVMVHLDPKTNEPIRLPELYRDRIKNLEPNAIFVEK